jgi:hypothetical protein
MRNESGLGYGKAMGVTLWILLPMVLGCATGPDPIVIHQDPQYSIWIHYDPQAGTGHSHPYPITAERMAHVLQGIRFKERDNFFGFGLTTSEEGLPAFTPAEVVTLAPYLSKALREASPKDLVTFYFMSPSAKHGKLVTSGGLFVRGDRLYFILANSRSFPSGGQDYTTAIELNGRDTPLLPIAPFRFTVGFHPKKATVPLDQAKKLDDFKLYMDEAKLVVIDPNQL